MTADMKYRFSYKMPERKPRNMVFKFCLDISNYLKLLFFNSKTQNRDQRA